MTTRVKPQAAATTAHKKIFALISDDTLRHLYVTMLQCRMLDTRARALVTRRKKMRGLVDFNGQEATVAGIAAHLRDEDIIAAADRTPVLDYLRGIAPRKIFSGLRAGAVAGSNGHSPANFSEAASSNFLTLPTSTAAGLHIANGVALAHRMQKKDTLVAIFLNGAEVIGHDAKEALAFAAAQRLPVLFVVHNDLRSPSNALPLEEISLAASASGVPGIPVDGRDVVAVYRVAQEAITRARDDGGPTLIEAVTFPESGGSGLDTANDSLAHMEKYLAGKGLYSEKWKQQLTSAFERRLEAALRQ